jgi:hypothetical protein
VLLPTVAVSTVLGHLVMHAASLVLEVRAADETGGGNGGGGSGGGGSGGGSGGSGGGGGSGSGSGGSGGGGSGGGGALACGWHRKASLASSLLWNEGGEREEAADAGGLVYARLAAAPVNATVRSDGHA